MHRLCLLALLVLLTVPAARAATYYVATNGVDTNPGTLAQPFLTIGKGIATATSGDTVLVAPGTYFEHVLWTNKTLILQGAGPGLSLIDAGGTGTCLALSNAANSQIHGFTIQNAISSGLFIYQSSPTVTNCFFNGNGGGGMSLLHCNPQVNNCTFTNNDNGIYCSDGAVVLAANNCTFSRNTGSGIYNSKGNGWCGAFNCTFSNNGGDGIVNQNFASPPVTGCTFSNNAGRGISNDRGNGNVSQCIFVGNGGGGIYNYNGSSPTVTQCQFTNNSAATGGGMDNEFGSNPTVNNCIFSGNNGGGMHNTASSPNLTNCIFTGNTASVGAGMYNNVGSSPNLNNCIFTGNNASQTCGGMLNASSSNPTLNNCTFTGNHAANNLGGMYNVSSNPILNNCILWGDGAEIFDDFDSGSSAVVSYSDVAGGFAGTGNINADPLFVNPVAGNYRLQSGSPCINAGSASVTNLPATDLDGNPRTSGSAPDMGAYELWQGPWYVDRALGNDANAGTTTAPFATATRAITAAASNDTIYIKAGNYGSDTNHITKAVRLANWLNTGKARIGAP